MHSSRSNVCAGVGGGGAGVADAEEVGIKDLLCAADADAPPLSCCICACSASDDCDGDAFGHERRGGSIGSGFDSRELSGGNESSGRLLASNAILELAIELPCCACGVGEPRASASRAVVVEREGSVGGSGLLTSRESEVDECTRQVLVLLFEGFELESELATEHVLP